MGARESRALMMGAILPHTKIFGGVKRFFELGNIFWQGGHTLIIFTPDGVGPDWYDYPSKVERLSELQRYNLDALFLTETQFLNDLLNSPAQLKILYHVGPRVTLRQVLKRKEVVVFVNSSNMYALDERRYGIKPVKAFGGVHMPQTTEKHRIAGQPFVVMAYGRLSRKGKGTALVVKACEKLYRMGYNIKLLLFDSPLDEASHDKIKNFHCKVPFEFVVNHPVQQNSLLFSRADVFVAAEKKGGWSNTAAEALAAGVPLIGTSTGTKDFLIHKQTGLLVWRHPYFIRKALERIINDPVLASTLGSNGRNKIAAYTWTRLADFIVTYVSARV
jgi:glycosyltransferase involved in cell wall biosynthesis